MPKNNAAQTVKPNRISCPIKLNISICPLHITHMKSASAPGMPPAAACDNYPTAKNMPPVFRNVATPEMQTKSSEMPSSPHIPNIPNCFLRGQTSNFSNRTFVPRIRVQFSKESVMINVSKHEQDAAFSPQMFTPINT
jgi:hypothetical protein